MYLFGLADFILCRRPGDWETLLSYPIQPQNPDRYNMKPTASVDGEKDGEGDGKLVVSINSIRREDEPTNG